MMTIASLPGQKTLFTFLSVVQYNKPTLFRCLSSYSIVYPGENIKIIIDSNADIVFQVKNNEQRSRELMFQNIFQTLDQKIMPEFSGRSRDYSIEVKQEVIAIGPKFSRAFNRRGDVKAILNERLFHRFRFQRLVLFL